MLTLNDGRKGLYQWDTGRTATVAIECDVVHFANLKYGESLAVEVKAGEVSIPNKLLTSGAPIYCWAFVKDESGAYTKKEQALDVVKRAKPSDYVYTETEVITIQTAVRNALQEAKESGDFKGEKGETGATGPAGKDGANGKDGVDGKDGTSVTVSNVSESTEDGGNNVVTFSDGKTLTVKNGSKGRQGEKGDPTDIQQKTGQSTTAVMSQKATTDAIDVLKSDLNNKKSAYESAVAGGYTGTEEEFYINLSKVGGEEKKNLFSFENSHQYIALLSKNKPAENYIAAQSGNTYGYKDGSNGYFVFTPNSFNVGITDGLELPLQAGSYKISADIYIPSETSTRTKVKFGAFIAPSVYADLTDFDLGVQDTWVAVEKVITVAEGDTHVYPVASNYIDKYPFYVKNIKVISLAPQLDGWEGKKWAAVGDSITEKNGKALKQYHDYIAESTGITVINMGVSGTGYKQYEDTNNAFYQRILNVPTDADVVTIFGSGNDLNHTLGDVTDTGTDTLCGCINTTIDNLYSVLPTVQLGIITPTPWGGFNPSDDSNKMAQYSAKIVEICRLRGIPCLDLYHCSGMRPWDDTFCSSAYNINAAGDDYDRVHPNSTGHAVFAPRIKAFLQSLLI